MASLRPTTPGGSSKHVVVVDVYDAPIEDEDAILIYRWLDSLEFSRCRKTSANRDFADGVMMAELVAHYIPKIINSTYYIPTSSTSKKLSNWEHLNSKVFRRIGFQLTPEVIKELAAARPGMIEQVLKPLQPILLQGPRAVIPVSKRLENVKPRFMDFEKNYLNKKADRPQTADSKASNKPSVRPKTAESVRPRSMSRQRIPIRTKNSCIPKPISTPHAPLELEVIKNPRSLPKPVQEVLPTQSRSVHSTPSTPPDRVKTEGNKEQMEQPVSLAGNIETNSNSISSFKNRRLPVRSSWLPVDGDNSGEQEPAGYCSSSGSASILTDKDESENENEESGDNGGWNNDNNASKICNAAKTYSAIEEEADEEIYLNCDQSGYEEDTEDDASGDDGEGVLDEDPDPVFIPSSGDTGTKQPKRKLKKVVKYEYREEFLLNMAGQYKLPNSTQLENVRRDYMNPGNKDPNCRGYGFV